MNLKYLREPGFGRDLGPIEHGKDPQFTFCTINDLATFDTGFNVNYISKAVDILGGISTPTAGMTRQTTFGSNIQGCT